MLTPCELIGSKLIDKTSRHCLGIHFSFCLTGILIISDFYRNSQIYNGFALKCHVVRYIAGEFRCYAVWVGDFPCNSDRGFGSGFCLCGNTDLCLLTLFVFEIIYNSDRRVHIIVRCKIYVIVCADFARLVACDLGSSFQCKLSCNEDTASEFARLVAGDHSILKCKADICSDLDTAAATAVQEVSACDRSDMIINGCADYCQIQYSIKI